MTILLHSHNPPGAIPTGPDPITNALRGDIVGKREEIDTQATGSDGPFVNEKKLYVVRDRDPFLNVQTTITNGEEGIIP